MDARFIAAAIPFFFVLIGVEIAILRRQSRGRGREVGYALHDSIANLSCGVGQQVIGAFYGLLTLAGYAFVYDRARLFTISPRSIGAWVALTFALDLCYYAFHRASHRINFIWAGHVVHHQSEEYNLSVALRQSWFVGLVGWVFYVPLAIVGFPPLMYLTMTTLNTLYQFWIHTRTVEKMPRWIEWWLNTPSHHRVHHGVDPKYIDKNYAGMFIVWDRMFGTFQEEEEEPTYGIVKPLASFDALWANVEYFAAMAKMARETTSWRDKILVPFMPPEWRPRDLGGRVVIPEVDRAKYRKYSLRTSPTTDRIALVWFVVVVLATTAFLLVKKDLSMAPRAAFGAAIVASLIGIGWMVERWTGRLTAVAVQSPPAAHPSPPRR
jgi:sterol desaturase/sphingolipid hydroxylase (fatty acid hydroxylase superfamily)